jgi:hypothetical protein
MVNKKVLMGLMFLSTFASGAQAWESISGQNAGIKEKLCVVVRSQQQWAELWAKHTAGQPQARPAVDFSREMVVAVFLGERSTAGYQVELKPMPDPIEPKSRLVVFYREIPPSSADYSAAVMTEPFEILKLPKAPEVTFEEDQPASIPENPVPPQSSFNARDDARLQKTVDDLQSLAAAPETIF